MYRKKPVFSCTVLDLWSKYGTFFPRLGTVALSRETLYLHVHLHFPIGAFAKLYLSKLDVFQSRRLPAILRDIHTKDHEPGFGACADKLGVHWEGYGHLFGTDMHHLFREMKGKA